MKSSGIHKIKSQLGLRGLLLFLFLFLFPGREGGLNADVGRKLARVGKIGVYGKPFRLLDQGARNPCLHIEQKPHLHIGFVLNQVLCFLLPDVLDQ